MQKPSDGTPRSLSTPIFVFDDYIDYLKAWYGYAKRFRMTQREFIKRAGVGSQAYFSDILARRKKLALAHVGGFVNALELTGDSLDFFTLLVLKDHAKKGVELEQILRKLSLMRSRYMPELLSNADVEYFSSWKYPVIREYIISKGCVASLREIKQAFLYFALPLDEIRRTVGKLAGWGMITTDPVDGSIRPSSDTATITYSGMPHAVVNDVKRLFIESSVQAMEALPADKRHITMAIKGVRKERYEELCRKIDELRKDFLEDVSAADPVEFVYGLNVQLFPLMQLNVSSPQCDEPSLPGGGN